MTIEPVSDIRGADDVFRLFEARTNLERSTARLRLYRIERMVELMDRLGNPQDKLRIVHAAGSKGKGSTCAYTASLLSASRTPGVVRADSSRVDGSRTDGSRVGVYMSPHITDYRERIRILPPGTSLSGLPDRSPEMEQALTAAGKRIWSVVADRAAAGAAPDELPTTFELMTALAFCVFLDQLCDWVILETGLGGRLDATNVCRPVLTMITRIELEHTDYLGPTLTHVAQEKAGIIKEGAPVVVAPQLDEPMAVFRETAAKRGVELLEVAPLEADHYPRVALPRWTPAKEARLAMVGSVHATNAGMALAALRVLSAKDCVQTPDPDALVAALEATTLPGRGEVHGRFVFDGAHTPESAAALAAGMRQRGATPQSAVAILGIVAGKNVEGIVEALRTVAGVFVVSTPGTFKPGDPEAVYQRVASQGVEAVYQPDPSAALAEAVSCAGEARPILVTGSFYMVAEIRHRVLP